MNNIAVIGDIHNHFDQDDITFFNQSDYDLLLFVGDLNKLITSRQTRRNAGMLAQLKKPALFIPGNHDVANNVQLLAEVLGWNWLARLSGRNHVSHHQQLAASLHPVVMGAYSSHSYQFRGAPFDVIVARPYAMGGSTMSYAPFLENHFGVRTAADSTRLLKEAVDKTRSDRLLFLAHNGPAGLGDQPDDIWGCDFDPQRGDFGDRDLTAAITYATNQGKQALAVIAGHMHLRTKQGPDRPWHVEKDGIHYINAARVPRIFTENGQTHHHHVAINLDTSTLTITEKFIPIP